ncbi:MAG: Sua5/YciO/YrdC/YwlC family protein [Arenicellales bacterium]|nr:Sua5/YciO/YrdC/YwlC family protein [Arenicellales bacterium]
MTQRQLVIAADHIRGGGVIAYPTEYCFGLGCNPFNQNAVRKIFHLKRRSWLEGVIIIAANLVQLRRLVDFDQIRDIERLTSVWPGPHTWLLPALTRVPRWIRGRHDSVAVRITAHRTAVELCRNSGGLLVSTSANRSGRPPLRHYTQVCSEFGTALDFVVEKSIGNANAASSIYDFSTGAMVRK